MKASFTFDKDTRSLHLVPEDPLEKMVLEEMAVRCGKGSQLKLTQIISDNNDGSFVVELKVNGH